MAATKFNLTKTHAPDDVQHLALKSFNDIKIFKSHAKLIYT